MSLLVEDAGGEVEEIVSEENGILISAMLRQYFMALRTVGKWRYLDASHWDNVVSRCQTLSEHLSDSYTKKGGKLREKLPETGAWGVWLKRRAGFQAKPENDDSGFEDEDEDGDEADDDRLETEVLLMKKFFAKWATAARVKTSTCDSMGSEEINVDWTRVIAPVLEGRIKRIGSES